MPRFRSFSSSTGTAGGGEFWHCNPCPIPTGQTPKQWQSGSPAGPAQSTELCSHPLHTAPSRRDSRTAPSTLAKLLYRALHSKNCNDLSSSLDCHTAVSGAQDEELRGPARYALRNGTHPEAVPSLSFSIKSEEMRAREPQLPGHRRVLPPLAGLRTRRSARIRKRQRRRQQRT